MKDPFEIDESKDSELMSRYGIRCVLISQYRYKNYRYSTLSDAVAQAKRDERPILT